MVRAKEDAKCQTNSTHYCRLLITLVKWETKTQSVSSTHEAYVVIWNTVLTQRQVGE